MKTEIKNEKIKMKIFKHDAMICNKELQKKKYI